jgi:hypothetical protein
MLSHKTFRKFKKFMVVSSLAICVRNLRKKHQNAIYCSFNLHTSRKLIISSSVMDRDSGYTRYCWITNWMGSLHIGQGSFLLCKVFAHSRQQHTWPDVPWTIVAFFGLIRQMIHSASSGSEPFRSTKSSCGDVTGFPISVTAGGLRLKDGFESRVAKK